MYKITNLQTREIITCTSRDDLLSIVNDLSIIAENDAPWNLYIEHIDDKDNATILETTDLSLPLKEIVEESLYHFGSKRSKRRLSFPILITRSKDIK
ncbi:hypothetical protein SUT380_21210 (plasmid) [Streptococcus parasuis]|nr:hypothetical protein SUT380_21210 [Streptococcus parasuis]